jgi:hypothetical protein
MILFGREYTSAVLGVTLDVKTIYYFLFQDTVASLQIGSCWIRSYILLRVVQIGPLWSLSYYIYLVLVLLWFLSYLGTLFWSFFVPVMVPVLVLFWPYFGPFLLGFNGFFAFLLKLWNIPWYKVSNYFSLIVFSRMLEVATTILFWRFWVRQLFKGGKY